MRRVSQQDWENEHMHNPMTECEALAVDYSTLARDVARTLQKAGAPLTEDQILLLAGSLAVYVEAALTAHTASSGGEVVCWQYQGRDGLWRSFVDEAHRINTVADGTWPIRALYTAPPAAVPADALERLVVDWRDQAKRLRNEVPNLRDGTDKRFDSARDADRAADELAALIPKGGQSHE